MLGMQRQLLGIVSDREVEARSKSRRQGGRSFEVMPNIPNSKVGIVLESLDSKVGHVGYVRYLS